MKIKRFSSDKILYIFTAIIALVLGICMFPTVTNWGLTVLNFTISAIILIYVFGYLLRVLTKSSKTIKILTGVEMLIMILIAIGLILAQFKLINISEICAILGLALAMRGIVEMFRAYFYQHTPENRYPLGIFVLNIIFLVLGVYLFARPIISNSDLVVIFAIILVTIGAIFMILGAYLINADNKVGGKKTKKPKSTAKKTSKKESKTTEKSNKKDSKAVTKKAKK